ncbi:MAG: hypothetical protein ACRCTQ_04020 [Brevinemataceae bacterium]
MPLSHLPGPLIRFLLYSLVFTLNFAYEGVVVGIGVIVIYPFLSMITSILQKRMSYVTLFYVTSFFGIFLSGIYILSISVIDWDFYNKFIFVFPASMTGSVMLISWFGSNDDREASPFMEAFLAAVLILMSACIRNIVYYGTLDFRFGLLGQIYTFGVELPYKNRVVDLSNYLDYNYFSFFRSKVFTFWGLALLIGMFGLFQSQSKEN